MLLEPGGSDLAPGLLLSPSLVTVANGVTYVPVVNVGVTGATVHAKQVLDRIHQVEGIEGQQLNFFRGGSGGCACDCSDCTDRYGISSALF